MNDFNDELDEEIELTDSGRKISAKKPQKKKENRLHKKKRKTKSISHAKSPVAKLLRSAADVRKADLNCHETLWWYLEDVYELAFVARRDDKVFAAIRDDPAWDKLDDMADESDRDNLIPLLIKSTLGGDRRAVQQKASDYKIALAEMWRKKTEPKYVFKLIKEEGGIEAMKDAERKRRNTRFEGTFSVATVLDERERVRVGDLVKVYASVIEAEDGRFILRPTAIVRCKPPKKWKTVG
ncbi:hypothetical protein [Methylopila sp. M107]|uniref:hypothetical protein n=1 Tax=Methylopila sp. M107 TaxID=1101190 RepID=UPI0012DDC032|nr:hypothetical protein [Methylopila sp. M107]